MKNNKHNICNLFFSHGDYDIPCEESTTLSSKTQKPIGQIKNTFLPDNISNIAPSRVPPQPSIQTSAPPCYFIDFEKSKIRPIQITSPLHQAAMINSNLCYESPKVPGRPIVKNSALDTYSPKPNISSKKVISQNALADYHQQRHFAGGFNATPVPEVRQQRSPVLNLNSKVKKQRSKSSSGVSSKKNFHANNPYSEDSDASSCITQSTVRCVYKQNQDFRQQPNRADLFALSKSRRVNSNISNLGKSSLTDESESTRSVFTDVREVRNSSWFSRDKKKRIRRMLKMYNNDNSNLHYNHRNSSCTKVVLAELWKSSVLIFFYIWQIPISVGPFFEKSIQNRNLQLDRLEKSKNNWTSFRPEFPISGSGPIAVSEILSLSVAKIYQFH